MFLRIQDFDDTHIYSNLPESNKGLSIKDFRSQGFFPVRTFFGQGGSGILQMRTPHFLVQKRSNFSKFLVCPHGQGGWGSSDILRRRMSIFRDFVRTSFMDGL